MIKLATIDNANRICEIYNNYVAKTTMDTHEKTAQEWITMIKDQDSTECIYVLEFNDRVIAWSQIKKYSHKMGYARCCETSTYVDPDYCGQGYGRQLKSHMISQAKTLGYTHFIARIWADNTSSIRFHKSLGYEMVGVQNKIGYVLGSYKDVAILQLNV